MTLLGACWLGGWFLFDHRSFVLAFKYLIGVQLVHKGISFFREESCVDGYGFIHVKPLLGLGADPIAGEGVLPLWETQVGNEQAVVGCEGFGEEMPIQSSVQEPYLCVLGDNRFSVLINKTNFAIAIAWV